MADRKSERDKNFLDTVVSVNRVTKVTKGGKRFSFSAFVVSGDQEGRVGIGLGKSREVAAAIAKATTQARKSLIQIPLRGSTLPYNVEGAHGAAHVVICSASKGTGLIAGGAARAVMKALGVKDVLVKSIGPSRSGQNFVKAVLNALAKLRAAERISFLRDMPVLEIVKGVQ